MRILKRIPKFSNEKKYYYSSGSYFKETLKQYSNVESYIRLLKYNDKLALFSDKNISFSDNPDFKKNPKNIF